jgi:hypothetical protein
MKCKYSSKDKKKVLSTNLTKNVLIYQAPVAHTCNPSYSGGRDWTDGI